MTFRSPIFRKLLASAMLLIGVTLLALDFYLTRFTAQHEEETVRRELEVETRILAGEINAVPPDKFEEWAHRVEGRAGSRITVIDPSGVVLADSHHDPNTMENHARRPEILESKANGMGSSIRHSKTLDQDLCYLALAISYRNQPGYTLRLAVPLNNVKTAVSAVRERILFASIVAALLAFIIAYWFSNSLSHRISRLQGYAEGLVNQSSQGQLEIGPPDELSSLAQSLNRTSVQLHDLVERLSLESARSESILTSMVEGVLAVNSEMRVTFCNSSFLRAIGQTGPVNEGTPLVELIRDPELLRLMSRVLSSESPSKDRIQLASAEGRAFEVQAAPLTVRSQRGAIAILHDISDLERLERVRKDFVANVSHELRTPLTAIRGYAETLLEGALEDPENNRRFLEIIKAHSIRLNNISSDLLTLSELESGKSPAEPEPVDISVAVQAALRTVESEASLRSVRLVWDRKDDGTVRGDRTRLEQALINLLDNAVKFSRPNDEVRIETSVKPPDRISIVVADKGIGIPSEDLSRIFERFYRVDKARSREMGGTGLGLSIVRHVIERMGGSVKAESQVGKGSTFTILLPLTPALTTKTS